MRLPLRYIANTLGVTFLEAGRETREFLGGRSEVSLRAGVRRKVGMFVGQGENARQVVPGMAGAVDAET